MARFEKGQSGNPAGRPPNEQSITPWIRKLLAEKRQGKTRAEHIATVLLDMAEAGEPNAIKVVLDRIDGKVAQPIESTGTLTIEHVDAPTIESALEYAAQKRRLRAVS